MRATNIILTTVLVAVVTIILAFVVADNAQYSNPIHVVNGVAHISTTQGDQVYSDIEYITGNVLSVKPMAINTVTSTPITLPNTSSAHGSYTCDYSSHGTVYSVTNNTPCNER